MATGLAEMGARVVMAVRDLEKGEKARQEVISVSRNQRIDLMQCDLASQDGIRRFAMEFREKYAALDVLINNAGIYTDKRMETTEGFEYQIGVNHLGHFLLTNLLLDLLKGSSPSRIINVTSGAHYAGKINFDDFQMRKRYFGWKAYAQSKLANVMFTYELAHRLSGTGVTVNCLHPGFVNTRFAYNRETEKPIPMMKLLRPFTITPLKGAETGVYLAASPEVEGVSGKYFFKRKARSSSRASYDLIAAEKLWNISTALCGL